MQAYFRSRFPKTPGDSEPVYKAAIRAKALDTLRGVLPAATRSNVGIFGSGQAFEALLLRLRANPLSEARHYAELILTELQQVIPDFLARVDRPNRGLDWSRYFSETRAATEAAASRLVPKTEGNSRSEVILTDFDPDGEAKVIAAALYAASQIPDDELLSFVRRMTPTDRAEVLSAYVGNRRNRRHKPGRAFERTSYRFDILADYGVFRDLQRHRMVTIEWQSLSPAHGYDEPEAVAAAGAGESWRHTMEESAELYHSLVAGGHATVSPYAICMAYRVRFCIQMNAREAMHLIELRTTQQGHPAYRRICQKMHRLIGEQAGHSAIAAAMLFVDHSVVELERLDAERSKAQKLHGGPN